MLHLLSLLLIIMGGLRVSFVEKTTYEKTSLQSQNGIYKVIPTHHPGLEIVIEKASLYKGTQLVWTKECRGENHFFVSNKGTTVGIISRGEDVTLCFYDEIGTLKSKTEINSFQGGTFTIDGDRFFALSGSDGLFLFTNDGESINRFGICNAYAFSSNGDIVAKVNQDNLVVYTGKKKIFELTLPSPYIRAMVMSLDSRILSLIDNRTLIVFDLTKMKELYQIEMKNPTVLAIADDGNLIACASEERDRTSLVTTYLYNLNGEKVWEWSIKFTKDYETIYRIVLTQNNYLNIYATDDLHRFTIEKED